MTLHAPDFPMPSSLSRPVNVEVIGIDPKNQGAQLMLLTILQELRARLPDVRIGVDVAMPFEARVAMGVWGVTPADWQSGWGTKRAKGFVARHLKSQRLRVGLLDANEIDIVLDASGFAYGDYWGLQKFDHFLNRRMPLWDRNQTCMIALPQAWGPFSTENFRMSVNQCLNRFAHVYARDQESLNHLILAGIDGAELASDFTNLLKVDPAYCPDHWRGLGILIPNTKIFAGKSQVIQDSYLNFLRESLDSLTRIAGKTAILIHDGNEDLKIAQSLGSPVEIISVSDPIQTKAILSQSSAVISSRYHGLVSALSSGVPCFACGWSHKYRHLMADYGLGGFSVTMDQPVQIPPTLERFEFAAQHPKVRDLLCHNANGMLRKSTKLWDQIANTINAHIGVRA